LKLLIIILLVINPFSDLDKIAKVNKAKKEAERAYLAKDYRLANEKYTYLRDSLGVVDDKISLNLANTQYLLNDSTNALSSYSQLRESPDANIRSIANQQLGAMQFNSKKYEEALKNYKAALKADPSNADARYNYELLKKLIKEQEEQQEQNKDQQNKDQENKDEENKDKKDQEKQDQKQEQDKSKEEQEKNKEEQKEQDQQEEEKKDQQEQEEQKPEDQQEEDKKEQNKPNPIDEEKLKEMQITEEKARLILEAMKNNEVQYIQQNKRKSKKKKDPTKPDW
jgi:Ca-activated chloride channel family protein